MHEFSLAQNIVEIVTETALNAGKNRVSQVILEIGEISGVEEDALITALESLKTGTIMSKANVLIQNIKGIAECGECHTCFDIHDLYSLCPNCSSYAKEIVSGKEFNVKSIEAE
jgi:hydrogenase nickel incorporation protein HypA/HybF